MRLFFFENKNLPIVIFFALFVPSCLFSQDGESGDNSETFWIIVHGALATVCPPWYRTSDKLPNDCFSSLRNRFLSMCCRFRQHGLSYALHGEDHSFADEIRSKYEHVDFFEWDQRFITQGMSPTEFADASAGLFNLVDKTISENPECKQVILVGQCMGGVLIELCSVGFKAIERVRRGECSISVVAFGSLANDYYPLPDFTYVKRWVNMFMDHDTLIESSGQKVLHPKLACNRPNAEDRIQKKLLNVFKKYYRQRKFMNIMLTSNDLGGSRGHAELVHWPVARLMCLLNDPESITFKKIYGGGCCGARAFIVDYSHENNEQAFEESLDITPLTEEQVLDIDPHNNFPPIFQGLKCLWSLYYAPELINKDECVGEAQ